MFTAKFENESFETQTKMVTTKVKLEHNYGTVEYIWGENYLSVTAKRICKNDPLHIEFEKVNTTAEVIQNASCTNDEITRYTATFNNNIFETQIKEVKTKDKSDHSYLDVKYIWSDDNSIVTASVICGNDSSHKIIETVYTTSEVIQNVGCTTDEITKFTAIFENNVFSSQYKEIITAERLNHLYDYYTGKCKHNCGSSFYDDLTFKLSDNGEYYILNKVPNVKDLLIPSTYNNLPVNCFGYLFEKWENNQFENLYYNGTLEDWCNITFLDFESCPFTYGKNLYLLNSNNEYYQVIDLIIPDTIETINFGAFYNFDFVETVTITNNVNSIGAFAFYGCANLSQLTFGTGLKEIDSQAFRDCINLEYVYIPSNVSSISLQVFSGCTNLKKVEFEYGISSISETLFNKCINLTTIIIPKSVKTISYGAFYGCSCLKNVYYDGTLE